MFTPKVAQPETKTAVGPTGKLTRQHSTLVGRQGDYNPAERPRQRAFGNHAVLRLPDPGTSGLAPLGNQVVLRSLRESTPPALGSLEVGSTTDPLERDADALAEQMLQTSEVGLPPHARANGKTSGAGAPSLVHSALAKPGFAMDAATRAYFEPRFGTDLSAVRIHTDADADASARAVGAIAYAVGSHLAFAANAYAPSTPAGRRLLAHELAHALQQDHTSTPLLRRQVQPGNTSPAPPPARRVVYLDNDVLGEIADGNPRGAALLLNLAHSGADLRIPRYSYGELTTGADQRRAGARRLIVRLFGIAIDEGEGFASRKPTYQRIYGKGQAQPQPKDAPLLAAVAAARTQGGVTANAELMSFDGGVRQNARQLGIPVAPESEKLGGRIALADVRAGLDNLGLTDWEVTAGGTAHRIRPPVVQVGATPLGRPSKASRGLSPGTQPARTAAGEVDIAEQGPAPGPSRGGSPRAEKTLSGGEIGEGLLGGAAAFLIPIAVERFKQWFVDNYLQEKWTREQRDMVGKSIAAKVINFNILIMRRLQDILTARAGHRAVNLHIVVDTEWVDTDLGPAQTQAEVSYYELLFEGDTALEFPLFQYDRSFWEDLFRAPRRSRRREVFDIPLYK